jgi:hypothetical protein
MTRFKYEPVYPIAREDLVKGLESKNPHAVAGALYSATKFEEDWTWVQAQCLRKLNSTDVTIRWAAVTCLGDLAFLRRPLSLNLVIPALEAALKDPEIADPASFSLSMVKQFLAAMEP